MEKDYQRNDAFRKGFSDFIVLLKGVHNAAAKQEAPPLVHEFRVPFENQLDARIRSYHCYSLWDLLKLARCLRRSLFGAPNCHLVNDYQGTFFFGDSV